MTSHELVPSSGATGAGAAELLATALTQLGMGLTAHLDPAHLAQRTWLDTLDWRLYRAGVEAYCTESDDVRVLTVRGPDRRELSSGIAALGWPQLAGALPPGPIRDAVAPITAPRALVAVVVEALQTLTGRILDDEGKTIAHLFLDTAPSTPARLRVVPLRGYSSETARAVRRLHQAGLTPSKRRRVDDVLDGAGIVPAVPSAPRLTPELPADVAVARVLAGFLAELESTVSGTIADVDTECLHEFRVAVRRSRSALKVLGDVLPAGRVAWAGPELKWLGDVTTPTRDLDVHLEEVPGLGARLADGNAAALAPFADLLARRRTRERRLLVRALRSARYRRFVERWQADLDAIATGGVAIGEPAATAPRSAGDLAAVRVPTGYRRVVRPGRRITDDSPAEALHALRKRCKELRYLLEIFGGLLPADQSRPLIRRLKDLQDCLGTFQDSEVQRDAIRGFAAELAQRQPPPTDTLLALGELIARLDDDQTTARASFASAFEHFAGPDVERQIAAFTALTGTVSG